MNKSIMIPMQPQNAVNILNGKKTLELRTWIPKGYVGWVYVYVTKGKPYLVYQDGYRGGRYFEHEWQFLYGYSYENTLKIFGHGMTGGLVNGLVVFRFWFDEYDVMEYVEGYYEINPHDIPLKLCLDIKQINDYGKGKDLYAWHIKKLEVFDEPKSLSEFYKRIDGLDEDGAFMLSSLIYGGTVTIPELKKKYLLSKAPQKFCYCYVKDKELDK